MSLKLLPARRSDAERGIRQAQFDNSESANVCEGGKS